jgi:hypothetical protein
MRCRSHRRLLTKELRRRSAFCQISPSATIKIQPTNRACKNSKQRYIFQEYRIITRRRRKDIEQPFLTRLSLNRPLVECALHANQTDCRFFRMWRKTRANIFSTTHASFGGVVIIIAVWRSRMARYGVSAALSLPSVVNNLLIHTNADSCRLHIFAIHAHR